MRFRNLFGAFLGGMLGIFGTQWFITDWYPVGGVVGIIGVLAGFYHKEIPVLILQKFRQLDASLALRRQRAERLETIQYRRAVVRRRHRQQRRQQRRAALWAKLAGFRDGINEAAREFRQFVENMHFTQWAWVIRFAAAVSVYLLHFLAIAVVKAILQTDTQVFAFAYLVAVVVIYSTIGFFGSKYETASPLARMSVYYATQERLSRGSQYLYFWYLRTFFHNEGRAAMLTVSTLLYGIAGLVAGSLVVVPALFVWALAQAFYALFRRRAHLLCLLTTLTTVMVVALSARVYMEGTGLLVVALATGVIAGIATEVLRSGIKRVIPLRTQARILRFPVKDALVSAGRRYLDIGSKVNDAVRSIAPELIEIPNLAK